MFSAEQQEYVRCCALSAAQRELSQYIGIPMCQDCKWKLGTDITNNCDCSGEMTPEQKGKHEAALKRARELQAIIAQLTEAKPQQKGQSDRNGATMKRGFALIEVCIVVAIFALLAVIVFGNLHKERTEMPAAYAAWVKQTGNTKELTYDEWRTLMRANERQRDATLIFMPMN